MLRILILIFLLFACYLPSDTSTVTAQDIIKTSAFPLLGHWVMHIYIGTKVFHDQIHLQRQADGELRGNLEVPGVFTTEIHDIRVDHDQFAFRITIDEGRGPYTIEYQGVMHESRLAFSGFASTHPDGRLVGGFTGQPAQLNPPPLNPDPIP